MYKKRKKIYAAAMLVIIAAAILLQSVNLNNDERVTSPYTEEQTEERTEEQTDEQAETQTDAQIEAQTEEQTKDAMAYDAVAAYDIGIAVGCAAYGLNDDASTVDYDATGDGAFSECQSTLSDETEAEIDEIIDGMTLEEKVGQMFFVKNDGRFKSDIINSYPFGGIILFDGDLKGKSAANLTDSISAFQSKSEIPLLIGVDEEGGSVIRLSKYSTYAPEPFKSPRSIYDSGGIDAVKEDTAYKSELLKSYGINVNFAPVCDVSGDSDDFIYSRSVSGDSDVVSEYASAVVSVMKKNQIGSVLKHFPGYGSNDDTHTSLVRDSRTYDVFTDSDFKPFTAGIEAGADCVLVSHTIVECMDLDKPASLSYNVHKILRTELGFDGVIITDDLMMDGVTQYEDTAQSAVSAILAGNDMILSTYYDEQYQAVLDAVNNGTISEERIETSVRRILRWKYSIGIM